MKSLLYVGLMIAFVIGFALTACASLPTEVEKAEVGLILNQLPASKLSWGSTVAFPIPAGYAAGLAQSNGDVIRGRFHAEVGKPYIGLDWTLYTDGTFKGNSVASLGRQADIGLTGGGEIGGYDVTVGLFGRSGGAFASPNAFDALSDLGYDENVLEGYMDADGNDLGSLNPAATGLSFIDRNSVNALLQVRTELFGSVGVVAKLMPELVGSSEDAMNDEPIDQLIVTLTHSHNFGENLTMQVGIDLGWQRFRDSGITEEEQSALVNFKYRF